MPDMSDTIETTAQRHRLSTGAVQALADALAAGRGGGAQWSHPDLGGMGQWSRGGMLQIGDMFNHDLKARVAAAMDDLVAAEKSAGPAAKGGPARGRAGDWWPDDLGSPSSTGAQNAMRYACFPDKRRLAVERDGTVTTYDTGSHRLTGFSQSQSATQTLEFSGPDGRVGIGDLTVVDRQTA